MGVFRTKNRDHEQDVRIEAAQKDLDRITIWFANIETRSYVALTAQTVIVAINVFIAAPLFSVFLTDVQDFSYIRSAYYQGQARFWQDAAALGAFGGVTAAIVAIWLILRMAKDSAGHPSTRRNLIFHRSVDLQYKKYAIQKQDDLEAHIMGRDREEILKDITEQIYNSAIIIQSKIDRLRFCNNFIVAQLIFFVIFVFAVAQIGSIVSNHAQIPKHRA